MSKRKREEYELEEEVCAVTRAGSVFWGKVTRAGPVAFRLMPSHGQKNFLRRDLFKSELEARVMASRRLEAELVRVAWALNQNATRSEALDYAARVERSLRAKAAEGVDEEAALDLPESGEALAGP